MSALPDYWGADLPINRGQTNSDAVVYEYYKDSDIAFEAFKAGEYDFRSENTAKNWATGYDIPQFAQRAHHQGKCPNKMPAGMQGYVFNTRREIFKDPASVRSGLIRLRFRMDQQDPLLRPILRGQQLFGRLRTGVQRPAAVAKSWKFWKSYRGRVPDEVFTTEFTLPTTDGSGNNRGQSTQGRRNA